MRVGIPRALHYYHYFPMWKEFFTCLGAEVVISPPTSRENITFGCSKVLGDICLPTKVFCGHIPSLINDCDFIFIPSLHSLTYKTYNCPKFIGLPDLVRSKIPGCPPILDPDIDVTRRSNDLYHAMYHLGRAFFNDSTKISHAVNSAMEADILYQKQVQQQGLNRFRVLAKYYMDNTAKTAADISKPGLTLALIGHSYMVHDQYINHNIVQRLTEMGVNVVFPESVSDKDLHESISIISQQKYWGHEEEIIGAGGYYLQNGADGLISLVAFGCGPDSMMIELLKHHNRQIKKPFLNLVIDEHTAEEGLTTRLEAFVEMVLRSKKETGRKIYLQCRIPDEINVIRALGVPNFANVRPAFRASIEMLGASLISPPVTKQTISLGSKYSPEFACLPFKGILGTFIESLEQGADTLLMISSSNACRMGYYSKVQEVILRDLGYKFRFLCYKSSDKGLINILKNIKRLANDSPWRKIIMAYWLGVSKLKVLDDLQRRVHKERAIEMEKGLTDRIFLEAIKVIDETSSLYSLRKTVHLYSKKLDHMPKDRELKPLRVGIIGELYVVMEPFTNMEVEAELGKRGVEVKRTRSTFFSEWTGIGARFNVLNNEKKKLGKMTGPYLSRDIGGHGLESLGEKIRLSRNGYDGIVHIAPFTCMPEAIAQDIMLTTDEKIPVLTVTCDEQMEKTGLITRLDAFVDLMQWKRKKKMTY